jgi:hypothetical protein
MLLGLLDIGSNSPQLQVFEVRRAHLEYPRMQSRNPILLGEAFDSDGAIDPAGIVRMATTVNRAMSGATRLGAQPLYVFNTSAELLTRRPGRRSCRDHGCVEPGRSNGLGLGRRRDGLHAARPYTPAG